MKSLLSILFTFCIFCLNAQITDFESVDFKVADSIALSHNIEDLSNLPQLSYKLTSNLNTDIERFRAIYKWVCTNIANDYGLYLKNNRKRQRFKNDTIKFRAWNNSFRKTLFKKLKKDQRTICTGYAYLVKALAQFANIQCEIVQGYGRVSTTTIENLDIPNHSWNAVKLNGKWYLCDPTWASGTPDPETNRFTFNYNDGFFLADPKLFAVNHFPADPKWWLLEGEIPTFNTFLNSPVIYGEAYKKLERHTAPQLMHHNISIGESLTLNYQVKNTVKKEDVLLLIDSGYGTKKVKPSSTIINGKALTVSHQFKSAGFFDVHVYLNDALISTYTVEANR